MLSDQQDAPRRSQGDTWVDVITVAAPRPEDDDRPLSRRDVLAKQGRALIDAIRQSDEAAVETAVIELSRSRRIFAPLVFAVGAFVMLYHGLMLLFSNWRLTLIQVLPAMWIWAAMLDLKAHAFKGHEFEVWHGSVQVVLVMAITLVTTACFYLNAVFAFAISQPGPPKIRPAFTLARRHLGVVVGTGAVVGLALGVSAIVVPAGVSPGSPSPLESSSA